MKEYVKPTFEYVELRPEERLACRCTITGKCIDGQHWHSYVYTCHGWKRICHTCHRNSQS